MTCDAVEVNEKCIGCCKVQNMRTNGTTKKSPLYCNHERICDEIINAANDFVMKTACNGELNLGNFFFSGVYTEKCIPFFNVKENKMHGQLIEMLTANMSSNIFATVIRIFVQFDLGFDLMH